MKSETLKTIVLTAVCACALSPALNHAQNVQNASFESPSLGGGSQYQPAGSSWTFTPFSGIAGADPAWGAPVAPDGVQVAILQSWGPGAPTPWTNSEISQAISGFTPGLRYVVKFSASQRCCDPQSQDFNVLLDGNVLGHFQPAGSAFEDFTTASFTATAGTHTLRFVALNSAGYSVNPNADNTAFIDKVQIEGNNVLYTFQMQGATSVTGPYTNFAAPVFLTNPPAPQMFFKINISQTRF